MSDGTTTWTYTYDADGMRTSRTNGIDTYSYVYNGGLLTQMTKGEDTLFFTYDAMGVPATITHNGTVYFYLTNLQGDVIALIDANGNWIAEYAYDAWGNVWYIYDNSTTNLATLNPLTYRGYVFDHELERYYLQYRYYSPEIGRFINADSQLNTSLGIMGLDQFAYCLNNPIKMVDYSGNKPGDIFDTIDHAARDAAEYLGELSWAHTWEYAVAIYSIKTTVITYKTETRTHRFLWWTWTTTSTRRIRTTVIQYTYTKEKTNKDPMSVGIPSVPLFRQRVAVVHTHPMGSGVGITRFSDGDKKWANWNKTLIYVHGPNGELRKYDPKRKTDILLYNDLPTSPNQPWR